MRRLPAFASLLGLAACAVRPGPMPQPPAEEVARALEEVPEASAEVLLFRSGLDALDAGRWGEARAALSKVVRACGAEPLGVHAFLTLTAASLDPRNPERDPHAARKEVERFFGLPGKSSWSERTAEALYLLALDLEAVEAALATEAARVDSVAAGTLEPGSADPEAAGGTGTPVAARPSAAGAVAFRSWPHAPARSPARWSPPSAEGGSDSPPGCVATSTGIVGPRTAPRARAGPLAVELYRLLGDRHALERDVEDLRLELQALREELERIRRILEP